jgi:hypothetical protein
MRNSLLARHTGIKLFPRARRPNAGDFRIGERRTRGEEHADR